MLGWSPDKNLADIIFGKTFDALVKQTTQNIYITRLVIPLNVHRNLILICPDFAEKEKGFSAWLLSVLRTSAQLSTSIHLYCSPQVKEEIDNFISAQRLSAEIVFKGPIDLATVPELSKTIHPYDLIVVISSREGGISYTPMLDVLPKKMTKYFNSNSFVFIYPATTTDNAISNYEQEVTGGMLEKSLNMLKRATSLFKKE